MAKLAKYTLSYDKDKDDWALKQDGSNRAKKRYAAKADALAGGELAKTVGKEGASVKIKKKDGKIQQERTYPRSADPKRSKG